MNIPHTCQFPATGLPSSASWRGAAPAAADPAIRNIADAVSAVYGVPAPGPIRMPVRVPHIRPGGAEALMTLGGAILAAGALAWMLDD